MLYSYNLFCSRKGFSLETYIKNNPSSTYETFCIFLEGRNIKPPSKDYFDIALETIKNKETPKEEPKPVEEVKKTTKSRHRRKLRASKNDSDISE